jgi:nucleoside-diphosphate-sugar epimerase
LKKKILVIGGTGFIGINFIKKINFKNYDIYSLSRNKPNKLNKIKSVKYLYSDISDESRIRKILKGINFNYIVNFGGEINHKNKSRVYRSHYLGVKNLINFFKKKKIEKFIQIGSSIENGNVNSPQKETMINNSNLIKSPYGRAKNLATKELLRINKTSKFQIIIFRLYQVYGPHQYPDRLIPYVIKNCLENRKFPCSEATQLRDFIYVEDVVRLIKNALQKKSLNKYVFNIGSGYPIRVKSVIKKITEFTKSGKPLYGKIKLRTDESHSIFADINSAKKEFNWSPKTDLKHGLIKTIKFYKFFNGL